MFKLFNNIKLILHIAKVGIIKEEGIIFIYNQKTLNHILSFVRIFPIYVKVFLIHIYYRSINEIVQAALQSYILNYVLKFELIPINKVF